MKVYKIPSVVSYHIYGKVSNKQVRFELSSHQMRYEMGSDIKPNNKVIINLPYKSIIFNTLLDVFKKRYSYLQTKHLRTLIFYGLLNSHNQLPRINYYAFPDK